MHKYSFTFLLVVLISFTSKSQNLDLIKSTLNHFNKEFHHKPNNSNKWNQANLRITQNSGKKLDSLVQEKWNDDLQDWEYSATGYFYYDKNGNSSYMIMEDKDPNNTVVRILKGDIFFDEVENKTTLTSSHKLPESEEWFIDAKFEHFYDQNERLKEMRSFWFFGPIPNSEAKWLFTYNEKGQLIREIGYRNGALHDNFEYFYDENNILVKRNSLFQPPNIDGSYGEPSISSYIDYVKVNSQLSEEYYYSKRGDGIWEEVLNRELNYDANGNLVKISTFDHYGSQPELVNLELYEYNLFVDVFDINLFADHLWDPLQFESMANQPVYTISGISMHYEFLPETKVSYYFSEGSITNTESFASKTIAIYPNPTQSVLHIDGLEDNQPVTILNINGTQVSSLQIQNGKISTQGLMPGMYILDLGDQKLKFGVTK